MIQSIILAGGSGTRLWPLSRSGFPKQFLALGSNQTLFQKTCSVCLTISEKPDNVTIITNEEHRFIANEQLREINFNNSKIILEPEGRNTAPAMTLAALYVTKNNTDPILFVIPADQIINDLSAIKTAVTEAIDLADKGSLVILGIPPRVPHTGYGYIKSSGENVEQFVEKPDLQKAKEYIASGNFYWNAGIFIVKSSVWLNAINNFRPDIFVSTSKAFKGFRQEATYIRPNKDLFKSIPSESIDYAVIEKLPESNIPLKMVKLNAKWSDLGSWESVWDNAQTNENGNSLQGDILTFDSTNNYVNASSRFVGMIGINDLIVIETSDAILIIDKKRSNEVKKIVQELKNRGREEVNLHRKVFRPWGWYDNLQDGDGFKVKLIQVEPGAKLSLQKHLYRAEHWIVVKGVAKVTCGDRVFNLYENQSTFIPLGEIHRLSNPGKKSLEMIEVQSGSYFGEDDIIRFDDKYGRDVDQDN